MKINPDNFRGTAERELVRWGVPVNETTVRAEIDRIAERLDAAFGLYTDERLGLF